MDIKIRERINKQCTNIVILKFINVLLKVCTETLLKHKLSHKETETMLLFIEAAVKEIKSLIERS